MVHDPVMGNGNGVSKEPSMGQPLRYTYGGGVLELIPSEFKKLPIYIQKNQDNYKEWID